MRFRSTLIISLISTGLVSLVNAGELDYLELSSSDTNVLLLIDTSSSVTGFYEDFYSEINPAVQPDHPDNVKLRGFINSMKSSLIHADIVPPKTEIRSVILCFADSFYGEGDYSGCSDPRPVWFVSKQDLLIDILRDVTVDLRGGNMGVMRTSNNLDGFDEYLTAGRPEASIRSFDTAGLTNNAGLVASAFKKVNSTKVIQEIAATLDNNRHGIYEARTPLAETLYEAYIYYTGQISLWPKSVDRGWKDWEMALLDKNAYSSGDRYDSPMTKCSANHIVYFTDGAPTWDWHANAAIDSLVAGKNVAPKTIKKTKPWNWNCGADPSSDTNAAQTRLDELAGYMANYDLRTDLPGKQTITTHFASTWESCASPEILDTAAGASGGFHVPASDMNKLRLALTEIVDDIKENSFASFMSFNTTKSNLSGNPLATDRYAYVNISEQDGGRWLGNLKKFLINDKGKLIDKNGNTISQNDVLNEDAVDFWSITGSGVDTLNGGASSKMSAPFTKRYTLTSTTANNQSIITAGNLITATNNAIKTPGITGDERRELLNWAGGMDTEDIDIDGDMTETRSSLGDMINTKPAVAYYGNEQSVVFTGTNEGYLHAFDGNSGEHLYSFMPPELVPELKNLRDQGVERTYGIDGILKVYQADKHNSYQFENDEKLYLFFGLRRGGEAVYVLDITDREKPGVAWRLTDALPKFADIGQSWTTPEIITIPWTSSTTRKVVVIGGGLDESYQKNEAPENAKGAQIFVIDLETGELIKRVDSNDIPSLAQSVINKSMSIDADMNGTMDSIFFNDVRGNIYRCDIKQLNKNAEPMLKCGVQAEAQNTTENLYFFNAMDAAILKSPSSGELLVSITLTSGNRFLPTEQQEQNRLVTFFVPLVQLMSSAESSIKTIKFKDIKPAASAGSKDPGWYFNFPARGEKSFSQTLIIDNIIHFSTYEPIIDENATNTCQTAGVGTAKLYSIQLANGQKLPKAASELRWTGIAKGLPETPYAVINAKSLDSNYTVNLGIDNTDIDATISPLSRDYWYEPE